MRSHFIVDAVLNGLLLSKTLQDPISKTVTGVELDPNNASHAIYTELEQLHKDMMDGKAMDELSQGEAVLEVEKILLAQKDTLQSSTMAQFWLQYMAMVDILKNYLKAERLGDWSMHLAATADMLPYFAASGHNHYLKSSYMYLQQMFELETTHPVVHYHFTKGLFVVRRSDRKWGGIPTDQVIEQCLMRNVKTSGGLTHGSGMDEQQRNVWTLSMPLCAAVHQSLQEISNMVRKSGEQHAEMGVSRTARDWRDTQLVADFIQERNPFEYGDTFCNIATGVHAHPSVNVENAKALGDSILERMVGQKLSEYTFKRKEQAVTLATKGAVKIDGESIQVDTQLLFQRLVIAAKTDLESALTYELCTFPKALFETTELLHEAQKSTLADSIWSSANQKTASLPDKAQFVLDGGALLHRIPWQRGSTFESIVDSYADFVTKNYGEAVVVFDGYDEFSTKDMTHRRRSKGKKGVGVSFTLDMNLTITKDAFLSNHTNKRFIQMLGEKLTNQGCKVFHDKGDADLLIVKKAIQSAASMDTVLVGDDTDLLVLLISHTSLDASHDIFFASERKRSSKSRIWSIKEVKSGLGSFTCKHILFLHAFLGCDTSCLYGIGKGSVLKKFKENVTLQQAAVIFDNSHSAPIQIEQAGEKALVAIYNGKKTDTLNALRHKKYCDKVSTSLAQVDPKALPPTAAAAKFHSKRVFLQINQWKDSDCDMLPEEWGCMRTETGFYPTTTDKAPAPGELLKMIRCNCTTDCGSARCSCQKHGMKCSVACGHCRGSSCSNGSAFLEAGHESDSDDE